MKNFGLSERHIDIIKEILAKYLGDDPSLKVYIFGSRARGDHKKYSDVDLTYKSKKPVAADKIREFKEDLANSDLPVKVDIVRWEDIIPEFLRPIQRQKVPFWTPKEIVRKSPWRTCPLGEYWVRRHPKNLATGKVTDHDGHCRKSKSGKDRLSGDEITQIESKDIFKNPPVKVSRYDFNLGSMANQYDDLISGWTAYWNSFLSDGEDLHPDELKALIYSESKFRASAKAKNALKVGDAQGLVQITTATYRILRNQQGELKDHFVILDEDEMWEPSKNICAAVRWLFRKKQTAQKKLKRRPTWEEVFLEYKGILKDKSKKAQKIKADLHDAIEAIRGNP